MTASLQERTKEAYSLLKRQGIIDYSSSFALAQLCCSLLREEETEPQGRDIVIRVLEEGKRFPMQTQALWNDIVEVAGLYPYASNENLTGAARVRYEFHRASHLPDIVFHAEQGQLASELRSGMSVIASAPTSFGKSLLIDEIVASNRYKNLVIIQPTLALLDETRKRFKQFEDKYHVVLSTSQLPSRSKANLFLFTAERVVEYKEFPHVEFFVIDEFYKLSLDRGDDRAITLNQAFYKLLKHTKQFYLLGPYIKSVPSESEAGIKYHWFPSRFATVATEEIALVKKAMRQNTPEKQKILFEKLVELAEPTMIYCAGPDGASQLAKRFGDWMGDSASGEMLDEISAMSEWISDNVAKDWCLNALLPKGIAFHHGALPRHLGSAIVDAFNNGSIRYLFCSSTLIEGVNTSAKNIVLYDKKKGTKPIDYFDFRNIAGRAGRMRKHFIGRVFKFDDAPEQLDLHVDFPVLTQINAPTELLMMIDEPDLKDAGKEKVKQYNDIDPKLKAVLKQNPALPIEGQLQIVRDIQENLRKWHHDLSWRSFPNYAQLSLVLSLGWKHLRRPKESKGGVLSPEQLSVLTLAYGNTKSVKGVINQQVSQKYAIDKYPDPKERIDSVVFQVLSVTRHWFDYKLASYLTAISNLQKFVYEDEGLAPGDYSAFAAQIENGFLEPTLSDLTEYGIPRSAIAKIARFCGKGGSVETMLERLRQCNLDDLKLTRYELSKVMQAI